NKTVVLVSYLRGKARAILESVQNLESLDFSELKGSLFAGDPGDPEGASKAKMLVDKFKEVTANIPNVMISRSEKTMEFRIKDLEDSISKEGLCQYLASLGECAIGDTKMGNINIGPNGLGSVWVRCPLSTAKKITRTPRLKIEWTSVRIDILPGRKIQCYRCLEEGHLKTECKNKVDRSDRCYRCGEADHMPRQCQRSVRCMVCANQGLSANHRLGGRACNPPKDIKRKARSVVSPTAASTEEK
ncbi:hypothetical protein ALC62_05694, partial [Cyphomyrmex costatus]